MGLSFHDQPSLVEAVGSLRFNAVEDPSPNLGTGSIGQDEGLHTGLDDPNASQEMANISQERGDDANIGRSNDIQIVYR